MKDKNWITKDWAKGAILCAILGIPSSMVNDYLKNKPMLSTIWQIAKEFWNFTISALNFNLKVWWLIVGIIVIIVIIYLVAEFKLEEKPRPEFCDYRVGKFKRWRWTWDYKYRDNAWVISDLTAYCPKCDTPLIDYPPSYIHGQRFDCPRCDFRASDVECDEPHKIERIIWDNIDRKRQDKATHF